MVRGRVSWLLVMGVLAGALATRAVAQQCDDENACTVNDMCSAGACVGTPAAGGSCDDGNDCTVNDHCTATGGCAGDPVSDGDPCNDGCGTCLVITFPPGIPPVCMPKQGTTGQSCDAGLGGCFVGACQLGVCVPSPKQCPDTDGDPCTDNCNFQTGQCERDVPKCFPTCETCNHSTGACQPANLGAACDDFDVCTAQSSCQNIAGHGLCLAGTPSAASPTPTETPQGSTPTATPQPSTPTATLRPSTPTATLRPSTPTATRPPETATATPPGGGGTPTPRPTAGPCVGDCDGNGEVAINELIQGVNIALGLAPVDQCPSFDTNQNGTVEINELIAAVNSALNGCTS